MVVSEKLDKFFTEKMKEYPTQRSFLVPMLLYTQDELGYLSDEAIAYAALKTELSELEVRNVISYYSMLHQERPLRRILLHLLGEEFVEFFANYHPMSFQFAITRLPDLQLSV